MPSVAMTGQDTISIGQVTAVPLTGLADDNAVELTFPNEIASVKVGKNGNAIYAFNETGKVCEVKVRLLRGCADDKMLQGFLINQQANFPSFVLLQGQFVKTVGDGQGNVIHDTYIMAGGVIAKQPEAKTNVSGDTEQSVTVWTIRFSNPASGSLRAIT